jgi:hypothetical protein
MILFMSNARRNKMSLNQTNGKVVNMWQGKNNTYWALVQYWVGVGYQYVEREVSEEVYEVWSL